MSTALALWTEKGWKRNWQLLLWLQSTGGGSLGHFGHGRFGTQLMSGTFSQSKAGLGGRGLHIPMGPHFCKYFSPWHKISAQQEKQNFAVRPPGCLLEEKPTCPQVSVLPLGDVPAPDFIFVHSLEKVVIMLYMPSDNWSNADYECLIQCPCFFTDTG